MIVLHLGQMNFVTTGGKSRMSAGTDGWNEEGFNIYQAMHLLFVEENHTGHSCQ